MTAEPPSKVDGPHETVIFSPAKVAFKRVGAPGATFGVCTAVVELPVESVDAVVVTVTTLNTYAGVATGVGEGVGVEVGGVTEAALNLIDARPNRLLESTDALPNEAELAVGVEV